jgi:hypothetical protein
MKKIWFVALPALVLIVSAAVFAFARPHNQSSSPKVSPTVNLGKLKQENQAAQAKADKTPAETKPLLPGAKPATKSRPAKLSASQQRELRQALQAAEPGITDKTANAALVKIGAKVAGKLKRAGKDLTLYKLASGKQFVIVISQDGKVLASAPATQQNN